MVFSIATKIQDSIQNSSTQMHKFNWKLLRNSFQDKRHFRFPPKFNMGTEIWGNLTFYCVNNPIQWTIANPVGLDWPAKCQKKTSCVSTRRPFPVPSTVHTDFF